MLPTSLPLRALAALLLFAALALAGWFFRDIVGYIAISLVLTSVLSKPTDYFSQLNLFGMRMPRGVAVLSSLLLFAALLGALGYMFLPLIAEQLQVLAGFDMGTLISRMEQPIDRLEEILRRFGLRPSGGVRRELMRFSANMTGKVRLSDMLDGLIELTSSLLIGVMAVLFITVFFLLESNLFKNFLTSLIPNRYFEVSISAISKIEQLLSKYMRGLVAQTSAIFLFTLLGMLLAGVEYAVTIALFSAVVNVIPYVGPWVGFGFALLVGFSTYAGIPDPQAYLDLFLRIFSVVAVVHVIDNVLLQPLIFSRSVKTHPLVIFLAVFIGSKLGGVVGMIIAIPSYTILSVTFSELYKGFKQYQVFRERPKRLPPPPLRESAF